MKVLYLVSGIGPPAGWGTEFIQNLIFSLADKGIQPTIINPIYIHTNPNWKKWSLDIYERNGVRIINLEAPDWIRRRLPLHFLLTPFFVTIEMFKVLRSEQFDLVHEFSSTPIILFRSGLVKLLFRIPTVFTLSVYNNSLFGRFFWFKALNFAKYYLIPSKEITANLQKFGINKNQLIFSPPGINLKIFKKRDSKIARRQLKLPQDKFIVSFFGSLTFEKGISEIIEASKKLSESIDNLLIVIFTVWKGSTDHQTLTEKIRTAKLDNLILRQEYVDVPILLSASDVVLFPQRTGFGTTIPPIGLLEALSVNCKIITTDTIGVRELINEKNGLVIPPNNSDSLAKAIRIIYQNKKVANYPTNQVKQYDLKQSIKLHLDVYKKVI